MNWDAVCQRSAGNFSSARATAWSMCGGTVFRCAMSGRGASDMTLLKISCARPMNGGFPASIS